MKIMKLITKVFTFLKTSNILLDIKTKLLYLVKDKKEDILPKVEQYLKDKSPEVKNIVVTYLINKISLPFYLKPFKSIVKKVIENNLDNLVEFISKQVQ